MEKLTIQESKLALYNLDEIAMYYEVKQQGLGYRFASYYYQQIENLSEMPNIGRMGKVFGTRELVLQEFPYLVVYRVRKKYVQILRIFHQQRKYPV
jgi:toxin ParE1/3/4